jgi:hypothetical protein
LKYNKIWRYLGGFQNPQPVDNKKNVVVSRASGRLRWFTRSFFALFLLFFAALSGGTEGTQGWTNTKQSSTRIRTLSDREQHEKDFLKAHSRTLWQQAQADIYDIGRA